MAPNVGTVEAHKDGHIADKLDSQRRAVLMQRTPLLEEEELNGAIDRQLVFEFLLNSLDGSMITMAKLGGPFDPALLVVMST